MMTIFTRSELETAGTTANANKSMFQHKYANLKSKGTVYGGTLYATETKNGHLFIQFHIDGFEPVVIAKEGKVEGFVEKLSIN